MVFWRETLVATAVFALLLLPTVLLDWDHQLADYWYGLGQGSWAWRDSLLLETWVHQGGRQMVTLLGVLLIAAWVVTALLPGRLLSRRMFGCLVLGVGLSAGLVSLLKRMSSDHCPWDLLRYGGESLPAQAWFSWLAEDPGRCSPAGHASAAYSLFAFYFAARVLGRKWASVVLLLVLGLGVLFGFAQQLRGAHFLSHDLWTAWLCWMVNWLVAQLMVRNLPGQVPLQELLMAARFDRRAGHSEPSAHRP